MVEEERMTSVILGYFARKNREVTAVHVLTL